MQPGTRVRLTRPCGDYPIRPVPAGSTGTVVGLDDDGADRHLWVLLDETFEDLEEWQNQIQISSWHGGIDPLDSVEAIPLTVEDLTAMAARGKPVDDEEWGSERQILAQNMVPIAMEAAGFEFDDEHESECMKATVYEIMDLNVAWFTEWVK